MDRGTYSAASAGMANLIRLQIVNNNLANIATPGFKKQMVVGSVQSFDETLAANEAKNDPYAKGDHERVPNVVSLKTVTDFSPGAIQFTGNALDVALREPNDFFVVAGNDGPLYTRAGNFSIDESGQIVTADGLPVQGDGGPISVPETGQLVIHENGNILAGDQAIGRLQIVRFDDPSTLVRESGARFRQGTGAAPQTVESAIIPNSLEQANVSTVGSIVELITVHRGFESYVKTAQSVDELNKTVITDYGRG